MSNILENVSLETVMASDWARRGVAVAAGIGTLWVGCKFLAYRKKAIRRAKWNSAGKDVVVLHQVMRGKYCPSVSPYVLKVECFLRLAGIKYVSDFEEPFGKRGLCPWITLNREDIEDSQHVVERLAEKFKVSLDAHLSPERKAALEAVRIMVEEQMFWILFMWRFYHCKSEKFVKGHNFPSRLMEVTYPKFLYKYAQRRGCAQGIARHSLEEQLAMGRKQMAILNTLLGDGQYFGGDRPCLTDCTVFGFLAQFMWIDTDSVFETLIKDTYPNLGKFCLRMKERVYPDWKKLVYPPQE